MAPRGYSQYRGDDDLPLGDSDLDGLTDLPRVLRPTLETTESRTQHLLEDKRVRRYLLKPQTLRAKIFCISFWCILGIGTAVGSYFLVPLFLRKVVVPLQVLIQTKWNPVGVAFLVIFGCALVPIILLPAFPFIWLAAVSMGVWKGFLLVQLGTGLGMAVSYALGKQFLRQRIRGWVERKDWAQALFIAVKEAGPFKVILLMRLGPAPYAWLNYACSLTSDIRFGPYILASIIGRSPHNLIDIYIGSGVNTAGEAASGEQLDPLLIVFYSVGFVLALCLSLGGYIYAKRALRDLKARALAREQVLTAFSFPELEEYDDLDSAELQQQSSAKLLDRRREVELSAPDEKVGLIPDGIDTAMNGLSRQGSFERLSASITKHKAEINEASSLAGSLGGQSRKSSRHEHEAETNLIADARVVNSHGEQEHL